MCLLFQASICQHNMVGRTPPASPTANLSLYHLGNCLDDHMVRPRYLFSISFFFYANHYEGSPAATSGMVCTSPPLTSDESPEAFSLIKSWIENCHSLHENCKRSLSGEIMDENYDPSLPTRVLDVGDDSSQHVVLIETGSRQGRYVALSHCWGPPEKRPLRTTKNTLTDHLDGIAIEALPKTFKDAVTITRALGVRYLWIDSLCIMQDSQEDWEKEASQMREVYQFSYCNIAGTDARDSTEGLIFDRPLGIPETVELDVRLTLPGEGESYSGRFVLSPKAW